MLVIFARFQQLTFHEARFSFGVELLGGLWHHAFWPGVSFSHVLHVLLETGYIHAVANADAQHGFIATIVAGFFSYVQFAFIGLYTYK